MSLSKFLPSIWLDYKDHPNARPKTFRAHLNLDDTITTGIEHFNYSLGFSNRGKANGAHGKKLFFRGKRIDEFRNKTLRHFGVEEESILVLQGYRPLSMVTYPITVDLMAKTVLPADTRKVKIRVQNNTTLLNLKHKLQDETGIPVAEQVLYHKGVVVDSKCKTVEFYRHNKDGLILKRPNQITRTETVAGPGIEEKQCRPTSSSRVQTPLGEKDGPFKAVQGPSASASRVSLTADSKHGQLRVHDQPSNNYITIHNTFYNCQVHIDASDGRLQRRLATAPANSRRNDELINQLSQPDAEVTERDILDIQMHMQEWKLLGRRLGLSDTDIATIASDHRDSYNEQKYQMLLLWKKRNGKQATMRRLLKAVYEERDLTLAKKIVEIARRRQSLAS